MDYAKERRASERFIRARDAFPGRYYTCPTCFAEVFLRRGRRRVPHFAHRSGRGKPDCENFHPSGGLTYTWPGYGAPTGPTSNYRPSDPLLLNIELQPESVSRGKRLRGWELRLTVPKSEDTHGQIAIDCGAGIKRTVALAKLFLAPQTYPVDINGEDFGAIWVSPEVRPEYKAVVEDRVRGLDRELATLFASTAQRYKPRLDRASWGNSYYLVWHESNDLSLPRKLVAQQLASVANWNCTLITLPDDEDAEIKMWLEEVTAVSISSHRRVFGIIYPPPCGLDILGRLLVPAGDRLTVGFRQIDSEGESAVALRATAGEASSQVSLEGSARYLVQIVSDSSRTQISLKLNETALPILVPTSLPSDNVFPHVRLVFREFSRPGQTEASLHSKEGLAFLEEVRLGQAEIFGCTSPSGVRGSIRWKQENDITWSSISIGRDSNAATVSATPDEIVQLNKRLKNRRCELEIDFGAFGIFRALPEQGKGDAGLVIPSHIRKRIYWLFSASAIFANEHGIPIKRLTDRQIAQLVARIRLPPQLAAQHRAIAKELARVPTRDIAR